jgi:hypothetical protein
VSLVYTYVERDIKITTVKLGINGAPLRDVSNFVNLGSKSHVSVAVGRFDAWLLPFLKAYVMAGYVSNNTTTRGVVTIPPLTPEAFVEYGFNFDDVHIVAAGLSFPSHADHRAPESLTSNSCRGGTTPTGVEAPRSCRRISR